MRRYGKPGAGVPRGVRLQHAARYALESATVPLSVLRALGAAFDDRHVGLVGPFDFALGKGEQLTLDVALPRAASIAARMFAAIIKPTIGTVYVGEYDTHLQPPQAKRRLGFVDVAGFAGSAHAFNCEVAFRAEVWNIDRARARQRAQSVLAALAPFDQSCARAVTLALVADIEIVVLDQPRAAVAAAIRAVAPALAIVETRVVRAVPSTVREPVPVWVPV